MNNLKLPKINTKDKKKNTLKSNIANMAVGLVVIGLVYLSFNPLEEFSNPAPTSINQVADLVKTDKVKKIELVGLKINVVTKNETTLKSRLPDNTNIYEVLSALQVPEDKIQNLVIDQKEEINYFDIILTFASIIIPVIFILYLFKRMSGGAGDIFSMGKSKAKMFVKNEKDKQITFDDVAGADEAKQELTEIVDFLKHPEKYRKLGARIPKGVLLVGQPGVGKTLLARAIANEANVPFYSMAGSEFVEMLVGVGASRVRDLFNTAKATQPALIFIDEIESIGRKRGSGFMGGHDEKEQTLNQILVEMDGFDQRTSVIVLGATNRPELLDSALLRPGRFDRRITLRMPDIEEREDIIKIHMKGKPFEKDVDSRKLAKGTVGFSGADIENMLNEAAIATARVGLSKITAAIVEESITKVQIGPERKKAMSDKEKEIVAYHEAGHAIVGIFMPNSDPIHRISIISRGQTLGHTLINPSEAVNESKTRLLERISMMLGGRSAEMLQFKDSTVGAHSDIQNATMVARNMVVEFGMTDLGLVNLGPSNNPDRNPFDKYISENMAYEVDKRVKELIDERYKVAYETLKKKKKTLDLVAKALIEEETIGDERFIELVKQAGEAESIDWDIKYGKLIKKKIAQNSKKIKSPDATK
ncbi:MAG: ATP-dependent zinc metalloprotease FtsH [bacterium]|nr:ATP-dependent zinc metalloprotease FtsH [bacterium]